MKPQYQRSNQALKAYYKNVNPTQTSITSQPKSKKVPDKQINHLSFNHYAQKSNQDIDWLEKIVNGFEWYKDKHDPLFIDTQENLPINSQNNKQKNVHEKDLNQAFNIQNVSLKNKGEHSQRLADNRLVILNNSNRSNMSQKNKEIKNQINNKNSNLAKNVVYSVKNKRTQSQYSANSRRKQYSVSISQLTANKQKVIEKQKQKTKQNQREFQRQRQKEKSKRIQKTKQKQKQITQKQNNQRNSMGKYVNVKKSNQNFDQTKRNICDFIQVCGINDITNNIQRIKSKLSSQEKSNIKLSNKIATIKAERKNMRQVITEQKSQKSRYGKIIKNKSVELKQRKRTVNSVQNDHVHKQRYQIQDQFPISIQQSKKIINQSQEGKYLVKQFTDNNQNIGKVKQNSLKKVINNQNLKNFNLNINNEIQRLILKQKDSNITQLETNYKDQKQNQKQLQKIQKNDVKQIKGDKKQIQVSSIRKQNQNKKYYYLIDRQNLQDKQQRASIKKQRKLNSSFGQRKLIYNYNQQKLNQPQNNQPSQKQEEKQIQKQKQKQGRRSQSGHVHTISFSCKKQDQQQNQVVPQKNQQKQQKSKLDDSKLNENQKKQISQSQKYAQIYRNVKFVESTRNSQVWTDHSMSIVLDKHITNPIQESIQNTPHKNNQQWDIMDIFSKLDCRKIGVLSANNCSIQYVSRQIRYILGPVLEEILYRNTNYTFSEFIQKVENTLEHVKDSQISSYEPQRYLKIKQWAPETQRIQQQPRKYESCQQSIRINPTVSVKSPQMQEKNLNQSSTKKYQYTKAFYQQINTQPSLRMKKKQNKEPIRFATFQDEEMNNKDMNGCFVLKDIDIGTGVINYKVAQSPNQNCRDNIQHMQQKLQRKLATLNNFQSTFGTGFKHKMDDQKLITSIIRSRCKSDAQKTQYRNQIVKLELLNQRLQRYLHDQTMKQYSTSKLLNGEI